MYNVVHCAYDRTTFSNIEDRVLAIRKIIHVVSSSKSQLEQSQRFQTYRQICSPPYCYAYEDTLQKFVQNYNDRKNAIGKH